VQPSNKVKSFGENLWRLKGWRECRWIKSEENFRVHSDLSLFWGIRGVVKDGDVEERVGGGGFWCNGVYWCFGRLISVFVIDEAFP